MEKIKMGILALALIGSGAMAFAKVDSNKAVKSKNLAPLVWYPTVSATNSAPDFSKPSYPSEEAAIAALGCDGTVKYCAREVDQATGTATSHILMKN